MLDALQMQMCATVALEEAKASTRTIADQVRAHFQTYDEDVELTLRGIVSVAVACGMPFDLSIGDDQSVSIRVTVKCRVWAHEGNLYCVTKNVPAQEGDGCLATTVI